METKQDSEDETQNISTVPEVPDFPQGPDEDMGDVDDETRERSRSPRGGISAVGFSAVQQGYAFMEIDITPDTKRQIRDFGYHSQAFVTTQLRRQRVEVNLHRLTTDEKKQFTEAKNKEVQQWLKYEVVRAVAKQ